MKSRKMIMKAAAAVMAVSVLSMAFAVTSCAEEGADILNKIALSQGNISQGTSGSEEIKSETQNSDLSQSSGNGYAEREESYNNKTAPAPQHYIAETGGTYTAEYFEKMDIREIYHEDFGIYEEAVNGVQFFYSTVANGEITDEPVILEMPAGFDYAIEKDGNPFYYESGSKITEKGTYVIRMAMLGDGLTPANETTLYVGTFHFRIQDKKDIFLYGDEVEDTDEEIIIPDIPVLNIEEDDKDEEEPSDENTEVKDEGKKKPEKNKNGKTLESVYDEESGFYQHTLLTGSTFLTDIPNGTVTNSSVMLLPEDGVILKVRKDGEIVEYEPGTLIEESGSYVVVPFEESTDYKSLYFENEEPEFSFRIIGNTVNDMGIYNAPEGCSISEVIYNGENIFGKNSSDGWVYLDGDGIYTIKTDLPSGTSTFTLKKDTEAPRFYADIKASEAIFSYVSEDIALCVIKNEDGEIVYSGNPPAKVDKPGNYYMDIYDAAGNVSSMDFSLSYRMNTAAIVVIIMIVLLAAGIIFYVKRIHNHMNVV